MTQYHVSVDIPGLRELSGTVCAFVGSSFAHSFVFFDVLLQLGQRREGL